MTTVFILSGFNMHPTPGSHWYKRLRSGLELKGYHVVPVDISWKRTTVSSYVRRFTDLYEQQKSDRTIIIGNSFGAVVALISAAQTKPDSLYLCSLSPFFKEDRPKRADEFGLRYFGKRRMAELWSISADTLAAHVPRTTKTFVLYGEQEHQTSPLLVERCIQTAGKIHEATLKELSGAPHDMSDERYTQALLAVVPNISTA